MAPEVQRPDWPYQQIANHIRNQIEDGQLGEGDAVPSARQIMQDWSVAMGTAVKALEKLKAEGYTRVAPGVGTVVASPEVRKQTALERVAAARRTGRVYPPNERAEIRSAEIVEAPERIADALGIEAGTPAIRRHRVTFRDDAPVSASVSWFQGDLAEVAPKLLEPARIREGTFHYIEECTGRTLAAGVEQKAADAATDQDAEDLGVEVGTPVLRGRNWMNDTNGDVLEYGESVSVPLRWTTHEYEITN